MEAARRVFPMRRTDETVTARAIRTRDVCHTADVLGDPEYQQKDTARVSGYEQVLDLVRDASGGTMLLADRGYDAARPGAASNMRAASSGLNTIGALRGSRAIGRCLTISERSSVTSKKNRSADPVPLTVPGPTPLDARCSR